jgi:hypothetical protein
MVILNPSLNDFILLANTDLKEVDHNFEFRDNPFLSTIDPADPNMQAKAARAAKLVLAYYWTDMDGPSMEPDMLRRDVEKIAENLREWVEFVIRARANERPAHSGK